MTGVQYIEYILDQNWTASISGRPNDVPKPTIVLEKAAAQKRLRAGNDVAHITDGGPQGIDPGGFEWTTEEVETLVSIDLRTAKSRIRMFGERGGGSLNANEAPRWGGLAGEARRILTEMRRGDQEFDWVNGFEVNDISGQSGGVNYYRVSIEVRLRESGTIDTST